MVETPGHSSFLSRRRAPLLGLAFLVLMTLAVVLQSMWIHEWRDRPYRWRDTFNLPSAEYAQVLSLGYDNVVADFLWLRMIQTFAAGYTTPSVAPQLYGYFDVITALDPRFLEVYSFAILGVGEELRRPDLVDRIVRKGVIKVPLHFRIPFEGGFYAYWTEDRPEQALHYIDLALSDPYCPEFVGRLKTNIELKRGRYRAAYDKYVRDFVHAINRDNHQLYPIYRTHLHRAVVEWYLAVLRERVERWHQADGTIPSMEQLRAGGGLMGLELPDWLALTHMFDEAIEGRSTLPEDENRISELIDNTIVKFNDMPPSPHDFLPGSEYKGYVIWPGKPIDDPDLVMTMAQAINKLGQMASGAEGTAERIKEATGEYPQTLEEINPEMARYPDPLGGIWIYNPEDGTVGSTVVPVWRNLTPAPL